MLHCEHSVVAQEASTAMFVEEIAVLSVSSMTTENIHFVASGASISAISCLHWPKMSRRFHFCLLELT